jgi:hypothetical protein
LLRDDGAVGTASWESGVLGAVTWVTTAAAEIADGVRHLEVRACAELVDVVVIGKVLATVPIERGAMDGVPGVYTDGQDDLRVAGFRVSMRGVNPYAGAIK